MSIDVAPTDRSLHFPAPVHYSPTAEVERALAALLVELGAPDVVARRWVRGPAGAVALVIVAERPAAPPAAASAPAAEGEDAEVHRRARAHGLTAREAEIAAHLARRRTNDEIATALGISPHTARHHTERILQKLGLTRRHAVTTALGLA